MNGKAKKWDFDTYDSIDRYDYIMRNVKRLRYDNTLAAVARKAMIKKTDVVLDIGTGNGNLAELLLQNGCKVIGLDPSTKMIELAAPKLAQFDGRFNIDVCENPFLAIPYPNNSFDTVVSTFSIHHLPGHDKQLAITEMKRVLKNPGGLIVIGDVIFKDNEDKARALAQYHDMEDEYQPTLDTFPFMFENAGFAVEIEQVADTVYIVSASLI